MTNPTANYEVGLHGAKAVVEIRDSAGNRWSIGALLGDRAFAYEGSDIGVVSVPSSEAIEDCTVTRLFIVEPSHG